MPQGRLSLLVVRNRRMLRAQVSRIVRFERSSAQVNGTVQDVQDERVSIKVFMHNDHAGDASGELIMFDSEAADSARMPALNSRSQSAVRRSVSRAMVKSACDTLLAASVTRASFASTAQRLCRYTIQRPHSCLKLAARTP